MIKELFARYWRRNGLTILQHRILSLLPKVDEEFPTGKTALAIYKEYDSIYGAGSLFPSTRMATLYGALTDLEREGKVKVVDGRIPRLWARIS